MVKLNLGCGPHAMGGWFNYDLVTSPGSNVTQLDLSNGILPHGDNSVDYIFSEHFIEHLTLEQGLRLLKSCYRVLKPGGVLRFSTPDLRALAAKYALGSKIGIPGTWEPTTGCQAMNEAMRLWGHQFLYDCWEIHYCLVEAGFKKTEYPKWHESYYEELRNLEVRPYHDDLIVEAIKG